jgi:hypothetical protein
LGRVVRGVAMLVCVFLVPASAWAQASITGTVKDTSGAVLPGVTVEASSPALIEKVRSAVTDASGQYRIVDLQPGTYSVTFTLAGFSTFKRDGIALAGNFTATINAEMKVGQLQETVTVTGEAPIVDVQSVKRQTVVDGDTLNELPAARAYGTLFQLNPSVTTGAGASRDLQVAPSMFVFGGPGGRSNEGRLQLDGLEVGAALNGGGVSSFVADTGNSEEVAFTTSGGLGEAEVGGPTVNIVPKTGGNTFKGSVFAGGVTSGMVGDNLSSALVAKGLGKAGDIRKVWDYDFGIGGPIKKDRLWFFGAARDEGLWRNIPNMWANANAGDPTKWTYAPDYSRPAVQAGSWRVYNLRLTGQATPRNRLMVYWDEQKPCEGGALNTDSSACRASGNDFVLAGAAGASSGATGSTSAPEIAVYRGPDSNNNGGEYQRVQQASWTSPVNNKLLLEAGFGDYMSRWGGHVPPGNNTTDLVRVVEQCSPSCPNNEVDPTGKSLSIANLTYRSVNWRQSIMKQFNWHADASYVTGAHSFKFGYKGLFHWTNDQTPTNTNFLQYRLNNGVPNQLTETLIGTFTQKSRTRQDSFYAQDQWTRGTVTLQGALRFDYARSHYPEQTIGTSRFLTTPVDVPEAEGVTGFKDLSPRAGVAWDVRGNGKTAVKINFGKYLEAATNQNLYTAVNPISRAVTTVTRSWTDANGNYVPDCDLSDPLANSGADTCGIISDLAFGQIKAPTTTYDPALLGGWSVRPGDWEIGASVQQQILTRTSVELGYYRRWLTNFAVADNLITSASDYTPFSVTVPTDSRLPNSGATISGLYDVVPSQFGKTSNLVTFADGFGSSSKVYNGFLAQITSRPRAGFTVQAGVNFGKTHVDVCAVRDAVPEMVTAGFGATTSYADPSYVNSTNPWCDVTSGWEPRFTGLASYVIPKVDVSISGTYRNDTGQMLQANRLYTNAELASSLGRSIAGNRPFVSVNMIEPGTLYGERLNDVDMRFAKILRFGRTRTNVGLDIYNIFNANPILTYNRSYGQNWLQPQSILTARYMKISAQVDF